MFYSDYCIDHRLADIDKADPEMCGECDELDVDCAVEEIDRETERFNEIIGQLGRAHGKTTRQKRNLEGIYDKHDS